MHTPETQNKEGDNLPVHSQEHCTQKVGRPPFLQKACNVTVGEEKRRTLLWFFLKFVNWQILKATKQGCCGLSSLIWEGSWMLFKNNPGKEENMHRGSKTKFPWWYFLHTGGFWLANEEPLTRESGSYRLYKDISLSFCIIFPSLPIPPSLITTPFVTSEAPPKTFAFFYLIQPLNLLAVSICTQSLFLSFPFNFLELSGNTDNIDNI